jgi:hypothetical protein
MADNGFIVKINTESDQNGMPCKIVYNGMTYRPTTENIEHNSAPVNPGNTSTGGRITLSGKNLHQILILHLFNLHCIGLILVNQIKFRISISAMPSVIATPENEADLQVIGGPLLDQNLVVDMEAEGGEDSDQGPIMDESFDYSQIQIPQSPEPEERTSTPRRRSIGTVKPFRKQQQ